LKISVSGEEIPTKGKPISDSNRVDDILNKFGPNMASTIYQKYFLTTKVK
jgi:hypothetical protein